MYLPTPPSASPFLFPLFMLQLYSAPPPFPVVRSYTIRQCAVQSANRHFGLAIPIIHSNWIIYLHACDLLKDYNLNRLIGIPVSGACVRACRPACVSTCMMSNSCMYLLGEINFILGFGVSFFSSPLKCLRVAHEVAAAIKRTQHIQ